MKTKKSKEKTIDDFSEYSDYKEVLAFYKCDFGCGHLTKCHIHDGRNYKECLCKIDNGVTVCDKNQLQVAFEAGKELGYHRGHEAGSESGYADARATYSDATGPY